MDPKESKQTKNVGTCCYIPNEKNIANNWFLSLQALLYSNILRTSDMIIRDENLKIS